jgi:hypothetical protein
MSRLYVTSWHRFNTVESTAGDVTNATDLVGTNIGTASLVSLADSIRLSDPTIIDNSGTTQTFSSEIPAGFTIKGIQFQVQTSGSVANINHEIRYNTRIAGGGSTAVFAGNALQIYDTGWPIRKYPSTDSSLSTFIQSWTTSNIDDLEFQFLFDDSVDVGDWYLLSNDFTNGPTPAVRVWYEGYPKTTITTGGKMKISNGKVTISP